MSRDLIVAYWMAARKRPLGPGTRSTRDTQNRTTPRPLPLLPHNLDLFSKLTADEMEDDESYRVVQYMDLAMSRIPGEESVVVDFAMQLPHTMGYVGRTAACRRPLFHLHRRCHRVWRHWQDSW